MDDPVYNALMDPVIFGAGAVLIAIVTAIWIFWPDDGYGKYSELRLRLRRSLKASWKAQFRIIFGHRRRW